MKSIKITLKEPSSADEVNLNDVPNLTRASFDKVELEDILDYIDIENHDVVLLELIGLLRYGGTLLVSGLDIIDIARQIEYGQITPEEGNVMLYKGGRKCAKHLNSVVNELHNFGLVVTVKQINQNGYLVAAKRDEKR